MKKNVLKFLLIVIVTFIFINVYAVSDNECENNYEKTGNCESLSGCKILINKKQVFCVADDAHQGKDILDDQKNEFGENTYDNYSETIVSCGNRLIERIPALIPKTISIIYTVLEILIPIILVIIGMLDLFKGITAQKEDEIKKGQQIFIKRLIAAIIIFFVFAIVKIIVSIGADNNKDRIINCAECFIKNSCDSQEEYEKE